MKELSGLELRKALLIALGWKFGHRDDCSPNWPDSLMDCWWSPEASPVPYAELDDELAYESYPGAFWPAVEPWLDKMGFSLAVTMSPAHRKFSAAIFLPARTPKMLAVIEDAGSLLEAGCRAWLKALSSLKEQQ